MAVGDALTVTVLLTAVPQPVLYVIAAVPPETPVITPLAEPAVATLVLLLLQVPPGAASLSAIACPVHTDELPDIAAGMVLT
jgi:hypothetical protein